MRRSAAALILAAAFSAGCGGGASASKSQFVSQANKICASTRAQSDPLIGQLASAAASLSTAVNPQKLAPVVRQLHAVGVGYVAQLRKLKKPSSDRATVESFLSSTDTTVAAIGSAADALARGDLARALSLLQQTRSTAQDANTTARELGMSQCAAVLPAG